MPCQETKIVRFHHVACWFLLSKNCIHVKFSHLAFQTAPFLIVNETAECRNTKPRPFTCYSGYIIDLLLKLNESLGGFTHPESLYLVEEYGDLDETSQQWNGIIGELIAEV